MGTTTSNNMDQLTGLESQDNTTVERVTMVVKDTADTTDVSQPEDTEEEGLATQEEDTSRDVESPEADPALLYGSYPYAGVYGGYRTYGAYPYSYGYYGKRSAEAEPKADADAYYYGAYGLGYAGYGGYAYGAYPYAYGAYPYGAYAYGK